MFLFSKRKIIFSLFLYCGLIQGTCVEASDKQSPVPSTAKCPSLFAVYQQQGPVCPYLPFENLKKVQFMRQRENGHIIFQPEDYITKIQSYAWFLPRIRTLDKAYDELRKGDGPYAEYEKMLRATGIKDNQSYDAKGSPIEKIDWFPTDQARRINYTPYNFKIENTSYEGMRWLPILHHSKDNQLYFYNYENKAVTLLKADGLYNYDTDHILSQNIEKPTASGELSPMKTYWCHFTDEMLSIMNIDRQQFNDFKIIPTPSLLGFQTAYFVQQSAIDLYNQEHTYLVGTYQHLLFACGVNRLNQPFTEKDVEWNAYTEFHAKMNENPLNPWSNIEKEDLFEYHLTEIFKKNPDLKEMASNSVNFYNDPWKFYKESFDFYDSPTSPRTKFSEKQQNLPGEDQMLAYYFASQLRFTWGASIGTEALVAIGDLEDDLGENAVGVLKGLRWVPGVPGVDKVLEEAESQKYKTLKGKKYSFLDTWDGVKDTF